MNSDYLGAILEQPDALHRAVDRYPSNDPDVVRLARNVRSNGYDRVILTGMGSSFYGFYPLWLWLNQRGIPATMWEASELIHYAPQVISERTLLICTSQSGESAEIRRLTLMGNRPGICVSVTNGTENTLARWSDLPLNTWAGPEASVSNKTYVTALAVLHLLGCQVTGEDVAGAQDKLHRVGSALAGFLGNWESDQGEMAGFLETCETLVFVARGPSVASAMTGALITAEASKVVCAGMSSAQFRHGPLELVREGFKAVVFAGNDDASALNERLAREIGAYGGRVLLVTPAPKAGVMPAGVVQLPIPRADSAILPVLEIVPVQLLTIPLARARGYVPAVFQYGGKVTTEE